MVLLPLFQYPRRVYHRAGYSNNPQTRVSLADTSLSFHLHVSHESSSDHPTIHPEARDISRVKTWLMENSVRFVCQCLHQEEKPRCTWNTLYRKHRSRWWLRYNVYVCMYKHAGTRSFIRCKSRSNSLIANRTKQQLGRDSDANLSRVIYSRL